MTAVAIIPARYGSTRFEGKPLARETGKYLIQHVHEAVAQARSVTRVIVATDDRRIAEAVGAFGGQAVMTRSDHGSGTDRIAEAAAGLDVDFIVNIQGDEPEIEPDSIDLLVELLRARDDCPMATLACPFRCLRDERRALATDPHCVKVTVDRSARALYFSRSLIPYPRNASAVPPAEPLLHVGIYGYRSGFLQTFARLAPTPLERVEGLEQLRALEHGHSIAVGIIESAAPGIDTPEDYQAFVRRVRLRDAEASRTRP